jgi:hypothetical protein
VSAGPASDRRRRDHPRRLTPRCPSPSVADDP